MGNGASNTRSKNKLCSNNNNNINHNEILQSFKDIAEFPPEIALSVLSNLNATDLCLASCVWQDLAEDELLWKKLCCSKWTYTSVYGKLRSHSPTSLGDRNISRIVKKPIYKSVYMLLDEATLIYSFRPLQGIKYLIDNHVMEDTPEEIAQLIHGTSEFCPRSTQIYLKDKFEVLEMFMNLHEFSSISLCDSLRSCFSKIHPPQERGDFLELLVEKFSTRFVECNPTCGFNKENVALICYSLLLLSVDLYSPHVKNKMSKREFIRNNRQVVADANRDVLSDMYDDVYLNGHIVPDFDHRSRNNNRRQNRFPFYRPYGAIFEFKPSELKLNCSC